MLSVLDLVKKLVVVKTLNVWLGAIILCGFVHVVSGRESGTSIDCTGTISDSICHEWHNSLKPKGIEGSVLTLAVDGASNYTLLLSENPTSQDQKAAEEMVKRSGQQGVPQSLIGGQVRS